MANRHLSAHHRPPFGSAQHFNDEHHHTTLSSQGLLPAFSSSEGHGAAFVLGLGMVSGTAQLCGSQHAIPSRGGWGERVTEEGAAFVLGLGVVGREHGAALQQSACHTKQGWVG